MWLFVSWLRPPSHNSVTCLGKTSFWISYLRSNSELGSCPGGNFENKNKDRETGWKCHSTSEIFRQVWVTQIETKRNDKYDDHQQNNCETQHLEQLSYQTRHVPLILKLWWQTSQVVAQYELDSHLYFHGKEQLVAFYFKPISGKCRLDTALNLTLLTPVMDHGYLWTTSFWDRYFNISFWNWICGFLYQHELCLLFQHLNSTI